MPFPGLAGAMYGVPLKMMRSRTLLQFVMTARRGVKRAFFLPVGYPTQREAKRFQFTLVLFGCGGDGLPYEYRQPRFLWCRHATCERVKTNVTAAVYISNDLKYFGHESTTNAE